MPSLKTIRKRIVSVKSTQKITRAMKMVAGARLNRAQSRILALRPYAVKTRDVLSAVVSRSGEEGGDEAIHPLLLRKPEKRVLYLLLTSDRGLCGSFNASLNKTAERLWHAAEADQKKVGFYVVGRKGRDYLRRRGGPVEEFFSGVLEKIDITQARRIAEGLLRPFKAGEVDAIYIIYSQFKSAMTQEVTVDALLPVAPTSLPPPKAGQAGAPTEYLFEPDRQALLDRLVPMYLETSILRALYDSQASELGARMTAMDSATKNAKEMIAKYTLQYNRARQAAITKELMEIIGGAEALKK
jgi:F-type H+-transporting ATPase subunit gamma